MRLYFAVWTVILFQKMMAFCISELQYLAILMRLDVGSGVNFDRPQ
jgi:hypothetical protein